MHEASMVFLEALARSPADMMLQRNFEQTMTQIKTMTAMPWCAVREEGEGRNGRSRRESRGVKRDVSDGRW